MESDPLVDMDVEFLPSMWPKDVGNEPEKKFNVDNPGANDDMLDEVTIMEDLSIVDFKRLLELTNYSEKGSSQLAYLVKQWEHRQENVTRLLSEELDILSRQRREVELKKLEILEEHQFEEMWKDNKHPVSVLDDIYDTWKHVPQRKNDAGVQNRWIETCGEVDSIIYWKQRAVLLENLLDVSIQREQVMVDKLQESIKHLERQCSPVDELSQILKRADNFLHFILQNAPIVIGHQDKELRYRFIYNHFPSLHEKDIIGRTDLEIFSGAGVKESHDFKKEVLERGKAAKREITFTTELFGSKTFLIYVEPVFSKEGETIGVNYTGMEITDQVKKREKMAKLREEIAVQNAKETEMNKTIHMTEETMRAKQLLATMSHEIRSPLSGVVSMAEILATTKLDREQQQLLDVMLSSGDLVLQLINDILDLSKVESGVMKLEATKFRPREVIKHVLQTAAASLQKRLTLEGHVAEDVPLEVIGDVLRIRQIFTNLISNAIKFTHEGKVGIRLYVVADPRSRNIGHQNITPDWLMVSSDKLEQGKCAPRTGDMVETVVWLCCDVYDTGIGIPENALPTLFKKYMQVSADHTRKYGGTGLGLAICKQLVELIGGHLTVSSREHHGSTFTFVLPYIVSPTVHPSDDPDELSYMGDQDMRIDANSDESNIGYFQFHPGALGSLPFPGGSGWVAQDLPANNIKQRFHKPNGLYKNLYEPPSNNGSHDHSSSINGIAAALHPKLDSTNLVGRGKHHFKEESNDKYQNPRITAHCLDASREMGETTKSSRSEEMPNCKHKILLVEDNKINVIVTQSMMRHLGHSIDVVNNGIEAVHAVQQNTYDLILMDVYMPVMDGLQATRLIRSFEETGSWDSMVQAGLDIASPDILVNRRDTVPYMKPVPIIAMTANALSESASECLKNGMDSFLPKPVTFQKLKECLRRYLPR